MLKGYDLIGSKRLEDPIYRNDRPRTEAEAEQAQLVEFFKQYDFHPEAWMGDFNNNQEAK